MRKPVGIIGAAALFLLLGTPAPVWAQQGNQNEEQAKADKQAKDKGKAKAEKQPSKGQEQKAAPQAKGQQQQQEAQQQAQPAKQKQQAEQQKQIEERKPADQQRQAQPQRQVQAQPQQDNRPPGWDKGKKTGWDGGTVPPGKQARLPQERQRQLITEQQARRVEYSRILDQQRARQQEWAAALQQQKRMTYYRYQQDYWARLRRQQLALQRNYNYNNDPYFYTGWSYRYNRGGSYYETNQYGANLLRAAINNGYREGYRAGQADRRDRFGGGFQNSYAYQDANLGYNGLYVSQDDYNYYFREGFNRGYQDGYNSRYQYGVYSNGNRSILGAVLSTILNLESIR